ncbi:hypothetical protein NMY3_03408 [Candidatus Nitrosocosmicus oleophilus]|uniref:Uncharacterized protein n=1 Tax=Candidatus Nitrosocosmicus oleophilus TaxID=1353260 RepID=A0A654M4N8_9ARCH|nr:hypothetical protein NMY3_03408 [Candidatus Nitrosocosmicus oleophilus]
MCISGFQKVIFCTGLDEFVDVKMKLPFAFLLTKIS